MPDDLLALLVGAGLGTGAPDGDLVMGRLPETPDRLAVIQAYGSRPTARTHDGDRLRFPRFHVTVRDRDAIGARDRALAIHDYLETATDAAAIVVNAHQYQRILPLSMPFQMTGDSSGRTLYGCNYEMWWDV
jgi:hypothetical protein